MRNLFYIDLTLLLFTFLGLWLWVRSQTSLNDKIDATYEQNDDFLFFIRIDLSQTLHVHSDNLARSRWSTTWHCYDQLTCTYSFSKCFATFELYWHGRHIQRGYLRFAQPMNDFLPSPIDVPIKSVFYAVLPISIRGSLMLIINLSRFAWISIVWQSELLGSMQQLQTYWWCVSKASVPPNSCLLKFFMVPIYLLDAYVVRRRRAVRKSW